MMIEFKKTSTIAADGKANYAVTRASIMTQKRHTMNITMNMEDFRKWQNGKLIQDAFPYLTPDEREFLKTGITPEEWDATFEVGEVN